MVFYVTDYGRPMKPVYIEIQNFWTWADKFGIWGIFGQTITPHFGTVSPLSEFAFWTEKFWNLAFMCP